MIRYLDHTADVQIEITAESFSGIFSEFIKGLKTLLVLGPSQAIERKEILIEASEPMELLVSLGREALRSFYGEQWVPSRFTVKTATPFKLEGVLWVEPFDPGKHEFHLEVKGVTYHDLEIVKDGDRWRAVVTFDV